ncbi:MAG: hypothetical protein JJU36_00075, partial [Phycisphaeraceae bacterium]|nr:hypothetical protein [Phycisphaeraceae bacterium]
AIELTKTMYEMTCTLPEDPQPQKILLKLDPEQRMLHELIRCLGVPMLKSGKPYLTRPANSTRRMAAQDHVGG